MTFDEWLEQEYGEDADWYEGWNKGDMQKAFEAGAELERKFIQDHESGEP